MRAGGQPLGSGTANKGKLSTHSISTPMTRVAPLQQQQAQPQLSQGQPQGQQAQSEPAAPTSTSSAVHRTSHNNYEIQTLQVLQNRSGQQIAERDRNSAKMLVVLVSGEQRLITFTLPRKSCTVQDLLEQVGVPFDSTTTIQCVENPGANIEFVVTVGFSERESASELISRAEQESGMVTSTVAAQQQQQLVHMQQQQQVGATPRFRSPPMATVAQAQQLQSSPSLNSSSSSGISPNSASGNNFELDLKDSIQAVDVKKDQQKPATMGPAVPNPMGTMLTTYYAKDDDNNRTVRTQNDTCITLAKYKKRHLPVSTPTSTATAVGKIPMRAEVPLLGSGNPNQGKVPTHGISTPVARVVPLQQQQAQHQQQPQLSLGQPQGQQAQSQPATPTSSAVRRTSPNNYEIQTLQVLQNRSGQQIAERDSNSAKMLVVLVSGEQRLITFTLPRESCTIQDLLEQVGVPFDSTTTIQCAENPGANIEFVVTVGFSEQESASELISRAEQESGMVTSTAAATASTTASRAHLYKWHNCSESR